MDTTVPLNANPMDHAAYEALVRSMVHELTAAARALGPCMVNGGRQNLVAGASGFAHQIDVSVRRPSDLLLIECKYWLAPVGVEPVLVLAGRMADISASSTGTGVHGSMVSTKEPTAGAKLVARHFGIEIDTVFNPREYALRVFNHVFVGVQDVLTVSDFAEAEVIRAGTTEGTPIEPLK
jgi:hypothetical protein